MAYFIGRIMNDANSTKDIMNMMMELRPVFLTILFTEVSPRAALINMNKPVKTKYE